MTLQHSEKPPLLQRVPISSIWDTFKFIALLGVIFWFVLLGTNQLGYNWQWYRVPQYIFKMTEGGLSWGPLMQGLGVTLQITAISMVFMLLFGLTTALLRMSNSWVGQGLARVYMELIRNSPLLIQLFFIYFVIAPIMDMSGFWAAVLALSLLRGRMLRKFSVQESHP